MHASSTLPIYSHRTAALLTHPGRNPTRSWQGEAVPAILAPSSQHTHRDSRRGAYECQSQPATLACTLFPVRQSAPSGLPLSRQREGNPYGWHEAPIPPLITVCRMPASDRTYPPTRETACQVQPRGRSLLVTSHARSSFHGTGTQEK